MSAELPDGVIFPRVAEIFVCVHERKNGRIQRITHAQAEVTADVVRWVSHEGLTLSDLQRAQGALVEVIAELAMAGARNAGGAA